MPKLSAGILAYRYHQQQLQVLLVHPGGPFYAKKDLGVWSIPKGEYESHENALEVALREFKEETGNTLHSNRFVALAPVKIKSGKIISCWAVEANFDTCFIGSNHFSMEWPPRSGKQQTFPEVDNADWFQLQAARLKIQPGQLPLLESLEQALQSGAQNIPSNQHNL